MAAGGLQQLRVLLTRPDGQAETMASAIRNHGASVWNFPLLAIDPVMPAADPALWQQAKQCFLELDNYRHIIFISTNATKYGLEHMQSYWPQWPVGIHWHAIGASTAQALQAADIPATTPSGAMNSEELLASQWLQRVDGEKILIVRGVGGRTALADTLRQRGARVDYAECYFRRELPIDGARLATVIEKNAINAMVCSSGQSLECLFRHLSESQGLAPEVGGLGLEIAASNTSKLDNSPIGGSLPQRVLDIPIIVPSRRVAVLAEKLGFRSIVAASNAGSQAVLAALEMIAESLQSVLD